MSCLRRLFKVITLALLFILVLTSCTSSPEGSEYSNTEELYHDQTFLEETKNSNLLVETLNELETIREEAISIKAPKAAPSEFNSGESYREEGLKLSKRDQVEEVFNVYRLAINMYKESIKVTKMMRERALAALESAEKAISQTEDNANKALKEGETL
jgi:PBP1b-binding outer membrane lipoprotein LpoB